MLYWHRNATGDRRRRTTRKQEQVSDQTGDDQAQDDHGADPAPVAEPGRNLDDQPGRAVSAGGPVAATPQAPEPGPLGGDPAPPPALGGALPPPAFGGPAPAPEPIPNRRPFPPPAVPCRPPAVPHRPTRHPGSVPARPTRRMRRSPPTALPLWCSSLRRSPLRCSRRCVRRSPVSPRCGALPLPRGWLVRTDAAPLRTDRASQGRSVPRRRGHHRLVLIAAAAGAGVKYRAQHQHPEQPVGGVGPVPHHLPAGG